MTRARAISTGFMVGWSIDRGAVLTSHRDRGAGGDGDSSAASSADGRSVPHQCCGGEDRSSTEGCCHALPQTWRSGKRSGGNGSCALFELRLVYRRGCRSGGVAVPVHPLSDGAVAVPHQGEDLTTGRLHLIRALGGVGQEANANGARDRVDAEGIDGVAVAGVDRVAHWLVACDGSLQGQGGDHAPAVTVCNVFSYRGRCGWGSKCHHRYMQ